MLKIKIITVGKLKEKYLKDGIQEYQKRLSKYLNLEMIELIDEKAPEKLSDAEVEMIKDKEGSRILSKIKDDEYVIALAIEGKMLDSIALSNEIETLMASGKSKMTFIIGGSNGLSKKVYERSQYLLSFSKMTFPHQLMKLILLEQIYRSFKIINNETYHK